MSGILGGVRQDDGPLGLQDIAPMARAMAHRGGIAIQLSEDGRAWLAECSHDRSSTSEPPSWPRHIESMPVVVDGRLDNRAALWRLLDSNAATDGRSDDATLIRRLYRERGTAALGLPTGDYSIALYDPAIRTLFLACDIIGVRPLSFHAGRGLALFATDNKAILAHPDMVAEPNDAALAEVLANATTGSRGRGETLFAGIFAVQRAQLVSIDQAGVRRSRLKEFDLTPHPASRAYGDLCEEFRATFIEAVARRLDQDRPTAITVSGGLDSSSIYCVAKWLAGEGRLRHAPIGLNFTTRDGGRADERVYTRSIVAMYPGELLDVPVQPGGFRATMQQSTWYSESLLLDPADALDHRLYGAAQCTGARTYLTGHGGDDAFVPDNHWYHLALSGRLLTLRRAVNAHHRWITEAHTTPGESLRRVLRGTAGMIAPHWVRQFRRRLRRSPTVPVLSGRLGALRSFDLSLDPVVDESHRFQAWQRQRLDHHRHQHYLDWQNRVISPFALTPAYPFLDEDLQRFLLRCDGETLNPRGRYKGLLRDALVGIVPAAILARTWKGDFTALVCQGMARDVLPAMDDAASGRLGASGFIPDAVLSALRQEIHTELTGNSDACHSIEAGMQIIALDTWLKTFI